MSFERELSATEIQNTKKRGERRELQREDDDEITTKVHGSDARRGQ